MDLQDVLAQIIRPTWDRVLPGRFVSPEAEVLLLAIGLQESRFEHREQIGGPARGFWQFEKGGGVTGVLNHPSSMRYAGASCTIQGCAATAQTVYDRLAKDDLLACAFARLLLYTDPSALPALGQVKSAWDYYVRNWRPGKPHPASWPGLYAQAMKAIS